MMLKNFAILILAHVLGDVVFASYRISLLKRKKEFIFQLLGLGVHALIHALFAGIFLLWAATDFARGEFRQELAQESALDHRFPREIFKKAGELGFIGLDFPEDIGGGMGVMENVLVVEEFCKAEVRY